MADGLTCSTASCRAGVPLPLFTAAPSFTSDCGAAAFLPSSRSLHSFTFQINLSAI